MLEQLRYLIQYQILEDKKAALIRSCEDAPARVSELEKEFEHFEAEYLSRKAEYEHAKKMHRAAEQTIADLEARIQRSKRRMNEVKTNKEYQAILKEIEEIKKEIGVNEDAVLGFLETIETLGRELKARSKELEERRKALEQDKAVLKAESDKLKERLDRFEAAQEQVREKLKPDLRKRSENLITRQAGIAVAAVENGVCQVCRLNIPPQKFIELQRDESIMQCPHCHRFIYWPGHEAYSVPEEETENL
ncbi:MAG TPA: C4-type zinc ribbon domain-containing protein [Syntrophobacteraceae bacterium]|nr:C4-type zinc ribbon domain-containing protein [Syntrophobacteraceae bacterium]